MGWGIHDDLPDTDLFGFDDSESVLRYLEPSVGVVNNGRSFDGHEIRTEFKEAIQLVAKRRMKERFDREDEVSENVRRRADAIQDSLATLFEGLESKPKPSRDTNPTDTAAGLEQAMRDYQSNL